MHLQQNCILQLQYNLGIDIWFVFGFCLSEAVLTLGKTPLSVMMAANELSFAGLVPNIDTFKSDTWEVTKDI